MNPNVDMLHLPVLPIEWYNGSIELVAITDQGGTSHLKNQPVPGSHLSKFGIRRPENDDILGSIHTLTIEDRSWPAMYKKINAYHLNEAIEAIYKGGEVDLKSINHDRYYYAIPLERLSEVPGELVDAAIFHDPERTLRYTVTPRISKKSFEALSTAGERVSNGEDELDSLSDFFTQYGFPRDTLKGIVPCSENGNPLPVGIVLSYAVSHAVLAFRCKQLWSYIERRDHSAIASMANTSEDGNLMLSFMMKTNQIPISYVPQKEDSMWRTYAKSWLYSVVESQMNALFVERVATSKDSFTIGVKPGGLQSAMWLYFAEKIYKADNPREGMRQCKQGGKFHGCGEWYVPSGLDDRSHYCPNCRIKAGAERVARHRAKV